MVKAIGLRSEQESTYQLHMKDPLRGLLAGAAAYKWGGGCLGTVLVFAIIYMLLGSC